MAIDLSDQQRQALDAGSAVAIVMIEQSGNWVVGTNRGLPRSSPRVAASPRPRVASEDQRRPSKKRADTRA